ncbi:hypothetical protein Naga_101737g2 [Nannochloropsis gaditana]|uniref:Uncharacterized protein n=1 Tax=Nannochloropsis gaditana TaxID=72520 RepID=W7TUV0_9STRA|nr:hypothetical protein Naga_101737g2 [Nannochloropsis gaditana]
MGSFGPGHSPSSRGANNALSETLPKHVGLLGPRVVVQNTAWVFMEAPPFQVRPLRCQDIFLADHPHYHPEPVDELLDRN